jgi:hypothetical protein
MTGAIRSVATSLAAVVAALILCVPVTVSAGVQLLTSSLLAMGGNGNPAALSPAMQQELGGDPHYPAPNTDRFKPVGTFGQGYIDTQNNPASPYYGWAFRPVEWPAQIGLPILGSLTYEDSQQQGVQNIDSAINSTLATLGPGERAVVFGYSSSANVVVREMRGLQTQPGGAPATDQLEFLLLGSPNRPNGGILQRFAGLFIPFVGIRLDGSTPIDTPYATTDISWQYDTVADFPNYPLNLLADLNALIPGPILHGNYFPADVNGPRAFPDTTVGNITYITLKPPHLPLLLPLYDIGFPKPLLDLVEPALTVMVDWGYDRSIGPGTPTTAQLIPRINPVTAARDLAEAIGQGVHQFCADLRGPAAKVPAPAVARGALSQVPAPAVARGALSQVPAAEAAANRHRKSTSSRHAAAAQASVSAAAASPGRHIRAAS